MKIQTDNHRRQFEFQVDNWVMVKLKTHRQIYISIQSNAQQIRSKVLWAFKIKKKISVIAYTLELLEGYKMHHTFRISKLKIFNGQIPEESQIKYRR